MYIYIYIYIYIYKHVYTHIPLYICTCIFTSIYIHTYMHTCTYTHTYTHMHSRAYMQGKHIVVMWYGIIMHLRRQPIKPKHSRLPLYLYPHEEAAWGEADVRPLYNIMQIGNLVARSRPCSVFHVQVLRIQRCSCSISTCSDVHVQFLRIQMFIFIC